MISDSLVVTTMKAFAEGGINDDALLRALFEHPEWSVPCTEEGLPSISTIDGRAYVVAVAHADDPLLGESVPHVQTSLVNLVRHLPDRCDGFVLEMSHPHQLTISRSNAAETLAHWVSVMEVEQKLRQPSYGRPQIFLGHIWLALYRNGKLVIDMHDAKKIVPIFTSADKVREFLGKDQQSPEPSFQSLEVRSSPGRELFEALSNQSDYDAIVVNPDAAESDWKSLSSNFPRQILLGRDPRIGG